MVYFKVYECDTRKIPTCIFHIDFFQQFVIVLVYGHYTKGGALDRFIQIFLPHLLVIHKIEYKYLRHSKILNKNLKTRSTSVGANLVPHIFIFEKYF